MLKFIKLVINIFLIIFVLENCNTSLEKDEQKRILGLKENDLFKLLILGSYKPSYKRDISLYSKKILGEIDGNIYIFPKGCDYYPVASITQIPTIAYFGMDLKAQSYLQDLKYSLIFSNSLSSMFISTRSGEIYFATRENNIQKLSTNLNSNSQAVTIYAAVSRIYKIVKDPSENYIYFIEGTNLKRIPINGGIVEQLKDLRTLGYNITTANLSNAQISDGSLSTGIGLAVDSLGNVFTLGYNDELNGRANKIIKLDPLNNYNASVLAGAIDNYYMGPSDGIGTSARFENIQDISLVPNNYYIFVADGSYSGRLRRVDLSSGMVNTLLNSYYISNGSLLFVSDSNVVYTSNTKTCHSVVQFTNYSGWRENLLDVKFTVTLQ